ncbi:MAG: hypothetical protein QGI78_02135 [Phycisphaerales bacterium]|jgi:hypothetical protein|nr:hypothetical protein [Phycisphaerales bacterium]
MSKTTHPFFKWPSSLLWLLLAAAFIFLFLKTGGVGSVWWYLLIPTIVSLAFIDLFTTIWFGIITLCVLFLYCSIGSSGIPVRVAIWEPDAWRNIRETMEMTEFEWFHWWPFKWLVAFLCLNMSIVTIRRIPLNILTVGVWTIHGGVIVMVIGCVVYFAKKVEGDVVISRARVNITMPNHETVSMVATPANSVWVDDWSFTISDLNPNWELMSGEDAGTQTYAVSVTVRGPEDTMFVRQLIVGYPEYTEDVVSTGDPDQPMARAKNVVGTPLIDETIDISLVPDAKERFFVTQSAAIYFQQISDHGEPVGPWIERPIENLPRFNDHVPTHNDVWGTSPTGFTPNPLALHLSPTSNEDPIQEDIVISGYLRYAFQGSRIVSGEELFPVVWVTLRKGTDTEQEVQMYAFDKSLNTADSTLMAFRWLEDDSELDVMQQSLKPTIRCSVQGKELNLPVKNIETFTQIGDTEYFYKVKAVQNNLHISGTVVSLAQVEIKKGEDTWERWVFDNPSMNRDVVEGEQHNEQAPKFLDDSIKMRYSSGGAPITIVGGLDDGSYGLLMAIGEDEPQYQTMVIGDPLNLTDEVSITIDRAESHTKNETRPSIVPPTQRDPSASNYYSMVKLVIPTPSGATETWLPFHQYPFISTKDAVRRFRYEPTVLQLADGRTFQVLFSRRSAPLPVPVALDSFEIDSHVGGFTGRTSSVLNWRSLVRFLGEEEITTPVSVNDPKPYQSYWFFQSQWDPPDSTSQGLNYTVLGVGNRFGVVPMLLGCCLTVAGMIWAFYIKPMIKRKRQQAVYERSAA